MPSVPALPTPGHVRQAALLVAAAFLALGVCGHTLAAEAMPRAATGEPIFRLDLPSSLALSFAWAQADSPNATPAHPAPASATAPPLATNPLASLVPAFLDKVPLRFTAGQVLFEPVGWKLGVGRGPTASASAARLDLSGTRSVTSAAVAGAGGNVELGPATSFPTVGQAFDALDGLGRRQRIRLETAAPSFGLTSVAASVAVDGDADLSLASQATLNGWTTAAGSAIAFDTSASGTAVQMEASAATRHTATGWNALLAGGGKTGASLTRTPTTFYGKVGKDAAAIGGTLAWSVDGAVAQDVSARSDRAAFVGAAAVRRWEDAGAEFNLRYRYHLFAGDDDRRATSHAVLLGARFKL